ncbi:MAG: hypothetical protein K6T83_17590 [Alicyclobacillus sp.]|nr:hypothetical protein [Alicyclobacillus sp.]
MTGSDAKFVFPKAAQYAFLYENAHLLMLAWDRDQAKFLFLIKDTTGDGLVLDYPGQRFTETVLDSVQNIFFVQVQEGDTGEAKRYVLGSFFEWNHRFYGAYYERDADRPDVVLFRVVGDGPDRALEVLDEDEYRAVAQQFREQHKDLMDIRGFDP